ncbi:hypothetical protein lerEdw1_009080 [Lerista edwardsae]|nr:hypothetical protein lerEdw1_009080 [Lerista edwardsae]
MPQLAQKVKLFIAFAPAYTLEDAKGFLAFLMSLPTPVLRAIFGSKEFCLVSNPIKAISAKLCSYPGIDQRCIKSLFTAIGFNENNINVSRADVYVGIFPDFTSVNTAQHWKQVGFPECILCR